MAKREMNPDVIVVGDVETTGLNENEQGAEILELAFLIVDARTLEVQRSWSRVCHPWQPRFDLTERMHPDVVAMHTASGLLDECYASGWGSHQVEAEDELREGRAENAVFVGAQPDFDRRWLAAHMPRFNDLLHYRTININSFWLAETLLRGATVEKEAQAHRALPDCYQALEALRRWIRRA